MSFDGALRLVVDACGDADGREMARRIGFMIVSGNTDAHLKNWSLLWGERMRPTLTPGYDLVATIAWPDKLGWQRRKGPELALALGGERFFGRLGQQNIERCTRATGLSWLGAEIAAGIERGRDSWGELRSTAPARMQAAIEEHWSRVPLLGGT